MYAKLGRELKTLVLAREHFYETVQKFNYARQLWQAFWVIAHQDVDRVKSLTGARTTVVVQAIDQQMEEYLLQILILDPLTISQDHEHIGIPAS